MKNFSAKNAEFETVTINNEAAISASDLGTAPNQIPLNKDLGSLAYQDAVNLDDVSADMIELRAIAAEISDSAVDVFVYDTSRDSDGGEWRKRTQHTSWYNEELNTATRGARREFPAVAVIVAEADKVTIYDGDDPDLSMWMVFDDSGSFLFYNDVSSVYMLNGDLYCGTNNNVGLRFVQFLKDRIGRYSGGSTALGYWPINIAERGINRTFQNVGEVGPTTLIDPSVNDVAMTILPNAPIDQNTGLPVPTIAVATDGGVSVIKDDGTVVNSLSTDVFVGASFTKTKNGVDLYVLNTTFADDPQWIPNVGSLTNSFTFTKNFYGSAGAVAERLSSDAISRQSGNIFTAINENKFAVGMGVTTAIGLDGSLNVVEHSETGREGLVAYINSKHNTGWMPGDIKLATLSDTTAETIGVNSDELLTNGGFDSDTSGWTQIASDWTVSNGVVSSSSEAHLDQEINCIVGQRYLVSFDITDNYVDNQNGVYIRNEDLSSYEDLRVQDGSTGTFYFEFTANSSIHYIRLYKGSQNAGTLSFDNISVRAKTELITNGDFSAGDDGNWLVGADTTATFSNDQLTISGTRTGGPFVFQTVNLIAGQTYTFDFDIDSMTAGAASVYFGPSSNGISVDSAGKYSYTFIYDTSMNYYFYLLCSNDGNVVFNSVSLRPAVEDRSVNGNGLQIIGEIDKTPVAPGADLVAYSGFSANNYLVQPYNEDLNFGTGDFCVMGWFNAGSSTGIVKTILSKYDVYGSTSPGFSSRTGFNMSIHTDGSFYAYTASNGVIENTPYENAGQSLHTNSWNHFCVNRTSGFIKIYINGSEYNSVATNNLNLSINEPLYVGYTPTGHDSCEEGLSLLRISKTAPTPEQIAKIYRDEKVLFQDGAQATLYGSSDAVTALAYDEKTELLHVGTASGRSDFSGLRRINNTTTAITTSISAHNNLIAEQ